MLADWTVLVVEDNPADAYLVARAFAAADRGARLLEARAGAEAIMLLRETKPDLVLLDLDLPDVHGFELLSEIKATHRKLPVVVMTGSVEERCGPASLAAGAQEFITKPGSLEELLSIVEGLMRRYRPDELRPSSVENQPVTPLSEVVSELQEILSVLNTSLALVDASGPEVWSRFPLRASIQRQLDRFVVATCRLRALADATP